MYTISTSIQRGGIMNLRISRFLLFCLIAISIVLNSCGGSMNQSITLQPSPSLATSTPVPITSTLTVSPTFSPTDWIGALLTTTPPIYPLPTLPPDCGTVKLGDAGTQTIDNSQKILVQGTAIICGQVYTDTYGALWHPVAIVESMLDLDTGTFGLESADIQFCPGGGTDIFYALCNINETFVEVYSLNGLTMERAKEPTFDECQGIARPYYNAHDNVPEYACVITKLGNVSRIKVEIYNPLGDDVMSLGISFITWEN
jgi:hypothetical protein